MKTLHLTLKKLPFEVMVSGEKKEEYRTPSDWIKKRLFGKFGEPKHYDVIKFTNGYRSNSPSFTCEYKGFYTIGENKNFTYSNGLNVQVVQQDIAIVLGKILTKTI